MDYLRLLTTIIDTLLQNSAEPSAQDNEDSSESGQLFELSASDLEHGQGLRFAALSLVQRAHQIGLKHFYSGASLPPSAADLLCTELLNLYRALAELQLIRNGHGITEPSAKWVQNLLNLETEAPEEILGICQQMWITDACAASSVLTGKLSTAGHPMQLCIWNPKKSHLPGSADWPATLGLYERPRDMPNGSAAAPRLLLKVDLGPVPTSARRINEQVNWLIREFRNCSRFLQYLASHIESWPTDETLPTDAFSDAQCQTYVKDLVNNLPESERQQLKKLMPSLI